MSGEPDIHALVRMGADRAGGWRNHFRRMERWQKRAAAALTDLPNTGVHDALDFAFAYFVWAHSLKEWLLNDGAVDRKDLDRSLGDEIAWPMVKDLANRSRHLVIDRNPTDSDWSVKREYDRFAIHIEGRERHHLNLYHGGRKYRLVKVIALSGDMWRRVLSDVGLHAGPQPK